MRTKILRFLMLFTFCFAVFASVRPVRGEIKLTDISEKLSVSGQIRVRPELRRNLSQASPNAPGPGEEDLSVLLRTRLGVAFVPTDRLRLFFQVQDSRDFGEEVPASAAALGDDEGVDLHQGYIEFMGVGGSDFSFRVGRQEIVLGAGRLVGNGDWSNVGRSFDGGAMKWDGAAFNLDVFATAANKTLAGDQTWFGGACATWKKFPAGLIDFYYLLLQDNDGAAGAPAGTGDTLSAHTLGARVKADPGRFDLSAEGAVQIGKFGSNAILAYAGHAKAGALLAEKYAPKLAVEYNFASGDDGVGNRYTKFNPLFPAGHAKYGAMDMAAWSNLHDGHVGFGIRPAKKWNVDLDYHLLMVDESGAGDAFGGIAGVAGVGKIGGHEADLTVGYAWNRYANFLFGYSHFIPGSFLKNQGLAVSSDFAYLQAAAGF